MSRDPFLSRAVAVVLVALLWIPLAGFAAPASSPASTPSSAPSRASRPWQVVAPVDFSKINLDDFTDDELDLPFFLHHFHTVANGVQETGPTRGFMTLPVWRGRDKNQQGPHNARVMESHLTLAFFYCTDRPWNPYFGDPYVRDRLEAMLTFWCDMQHADGRFSEYKPQGWNLPATAFATKFMGQTLTRLRRAHQKATIDPELLRRVVAADRMAIMVVLTRDDLFWNHASRFTNQYTNVFPGALAYLSLFDDVDMRRLLAQKFADGDRDFRSPAGYLYEADGPDFGYTLYTHHSNARMAYHYARGKPIGDALEKQEFAWNEWLGYNLLREPDGKTFVFNRGIQTRQNQANWDRQDGPFAETVGAARAFATSREERDAKVKARRAELKSSWGKFPDLGIGKPGTPMSPYNFLHRDHKTYYPPQAECDAAVSNLPYLAGDRFAHQRVDSRRTAVFTYVRRPPYYAAFNSGPRITDQQRLGLGLVWSPKHGALLQSQTNSDDHAWGTRPEGAAQVYEAGDVVAEFSMASRNVKAEAGNRELDDDVLVARYPLGKAGRKLISFSDEFIEVHVEHPGRFTEQVPLLVKPGMPDVLQVQGAQEVKMSRADGRVVFGKTAVQTVNISGQDLLVYFIRIAP